MKPVYIVFTGGCHSGKTTSMNILKDIFQKQGKKVYIFSEIIRDLNIPSIDELRQNPDKYIDVQYKIINQKIDMEMSLSEEDKENDINHMNSVVLIDRSITDSLFYLSFYTHKDNISDESKDKLFQTFRNIKEHLSKVNGLYNYILEFKPLNNINEQDKYRPNDLIEIKDIEYDMIHFLNDGIFKNHPNYQHIDLNNHPIDKMRDYWENWVHINF